MPEPRRLAVIMAGGRGVRFWPRSRRALPKQCLSIDGGPTLIAQTHQRMRALVASDADILVVTGPDMVDAVRAALPTLPPENILVEPSSRNTAPCVGLGAVEAARRVPAGATLLCVPADHVIRQPERLTAALEAAALAAEQHPGALVTIGIQPDRPETGYGYLELGADMGTLAGQPVQRVACFREKPSAATAEAYVQGGRHLWNAGMFVFTTDSILAAFQAHLPRSSAALAALRQDPARLEALWPELDAISIDYGIMERSQDILTVPCDPGWSDVGSWDAVAEVLPEAPGPGGHRALTPVLVSEDARGCVVYAPDRAVALLGVEGLVVVDAPDALLVCRREDAQEVRRVVAALEARGLGRLT